jgi:hypothetical protein
LLLNSFLNQYLPPPPNSSLSYLVIDLYSVISDAFVSRIPLDNVFLYSKVTDFLYPSTYYLTFTAIVYIIK